MNDVTFHTNIDCMKPYMAAQSEHFSRVTAPVVGDLVLVHFTKSKEFFLRVVSRRFVGSSLHIELNLQEGCSVAEIEALMARPEPK